MTLSPTPETCTGTDDAEGESRSWMVSLYISRYEQRRRYSRLGVRRMCEKISLSARGVIPG